MTLATSVPSRLWQSSASKIDPPVDTRAQDLPLEKLEWPDFERLCARLASRYATVEHAQQYGVPGQSQEGIDIYARKAGTERYTTWQCKRYQSLTPAKLGSAAEEFLESAWAARSDTFHLCATVRIEEQALANEIERLAPKFSQRSIAFVPLGKGQLSTILKGHSDLVDDFFGRPWVIALCGEEAASQLPRRKLAPERVSELRALLGHLYAAHFQALDPGLPNAAYNATTNAPLVNRFVEPDILEHRIVAAVAEANDAAAVAKEQGTGASQRLQRPTRARRQTQEVRASFSSWMGRNRLSCVIGDAGRGKTTLLRVIALDLLGTEPRLEGLARAWGDRIPVWIPFALWVRCVSESSPAGLPDVVSTWLRNVSAQPELYDLLREAVDDDRVLLLIDGIDEWTDEAAAGIAVTLLQTFVGSRRVAAIATSRPLGYERLSGLGGEWIVGYLAPLTPRQQHAVAAFWLTQEELFTSQTNTENTARNRASGAAQRFMNEVAFSGALSQLASTPLLLTGLIALHLAGERLPTSRFRAYERLTLLLTHEHSYRRVRSALTPRTNSWSDETRERVLDRLAFAISTSTSATAIDRAAARDVAASYLTNVLGRSQGESIELAGTLIAEIQDTHNVLVERSFNELGFLHKSFQDFHAARFLSREPLDRQLEFIREWVGVPSVQEVVLSLCFLTTRAADVDAILDELMRLRSGARTYAVDTLVAQIAFLDLNCSPGRAKQAAAQAINLAAADEWQPARVRFVHTVLDGLNSDLMRPSVLETLSGWFPLRLRRVHDVYRAMAAWQPTTDVIEVLLRGLGREEIADRHAAARTLAALSGGRGDIDARLTHIMFAADGGTAAACLNALGAGWSGRDVTLRRLQEARHAGDDEVRLIASLRRISLGIHDEKDREVLFYVASGRGAFQPRYEFRREIADAVVRGWPRDERIRAACLAAINARWDDERELKVAIAAPILFGGYPVAEDIAEAVAAAFHESEFLDHRLSDDWGTLLAEYRGHPTISAAVDSWLAQHDLESRLAHAMDAAVLSGTETAKQYVLSHRDHPWGSLYWGARALLAGWPRGDAKIESALMDMVSTPERAQQVANLVPEIVNDRERSEAILFDVLEQPKPYRIDGAVEALHLLGHDHRSTRFGDAVFKHAWNRDQLGYGSTFGGILTALHGDARARQLAIAELRFRDPQAGVIARFYGNDPELRAGVLGLTRALPQALRQIVAERLTAVAVDDPDVEALLADYDMEIDGDVKVSGAVGYWSSVASRDAVDARALARLNDDVRAVGFDYEDRRKAALAASIVIDRLDIPMGATLQVGDRLMNIHEHIAREAGAPLLGLVARHWASVSQAFGDHIWEDVSGERASSIEALAPYADEDPALRDALIKLIEIAPLAELGESSLLLLAREQRGSPFVRKKLFELLEHNEFNWNVVQNKLVAVDLLGRDFRDMDVADALAALASAGNDEALAGLCDWWPEHDYVHRLATDDARTKRRYRQFTALSIATATYDPPALLNFLSRLFGRYRGDIWEFHSRSTEALVRRLGRDEPLRDAAVASLTSNPSANDKASWPGLLRRSGTLVSAVAEWCSAEIGRQVEMTVPEFGLDVNVGVVRSVTRSLLDTIHPLA